MKQVEKLLSEIADFEIFITKRALELICARGTERNLNTWPDSISYDKDSVSVTFGENTRHDCPEYESVTLNLKEMEWDEERWDRHIDLIKTTAQKKRDNLLKLENERLKEQKVKQFTELKEELGM